MNGVTPRFKKLGKVTGLSLTPPVFSSQGSTAWFLFEDDGELPFTSISYFLLLVSLWFGEINTWSLWFYKFAMTFHRREWQEYTFCTFKRETFLFPLTFLQRYIPLCRFVYFHSFFCISGKHWKKLHYHVIIWRVKRSAHWIRQHVEQSSLVPRGPDAY